MHKATAHFKKPQYGFSLIEILISILVMSFGLLGISGLMVSGINNSTGSDLATRASHSASQIIDAMRANAAINTKLDSQYLTTYGTSLSDLSGSAPEKIDRYEWLKALRQLPGGDGMIKRDPDTAVINGYIVEVKFANCLGTLKADEKADCVNGSNSNTNHIRKIEFKFKI